MVNQSLDPVEASPHEGLGVKPGSQAPEPRGIGHACDTEAQVSRSSADAGVSESPPNHNNSDEGDENENESLGTRTRSETAHEAADIHRESGKSEAETADRDQVPGAGTGIGTSVEPVLETKDEDVIDAVGNDAAGMVGAIDVDEATTTPDKGPCMENFVIDADEAITVGEEDAGGECVIDVDAEVSPGGEPGSDPVELEGLDADEGADLEAEETMYGCGGDDDGGDDGAYLDDLDALEAEEAAEEEEAEEEEPYDGEDAEEVVDEDADMEEDGEVEEDSFFPGVASDFAVDDDDLVGADRDPDATDSAIDVDGRGSAGGEDSFAEAYPGDDENNGDDTEADDFYGHRPGAAAVIALTTASAAAATAASPSPCPWSASPPLHSEEARQRQQCCTECVEFRRPHTNLRAALGALRDGNMDLARDLVLRMDIREHFENRANILHALALFTDPPARSAPATQTAAVSRKRSREMRDSDPVTPAAGSGSAGSGSAGSGSAGSGSRTPERTEVVPPPGALSPSRVPLLRCSSSSFSSSSCASSSSLPTSSPAAQSSCGTVVDVAPTLDGDQAPPRSLAADAALLARIALHRGAALHVATYTCDESEPYMTPLHYAASTDNVHVAKVLLMQGASLSPLSAFGLNPLETAVHRGSRRVAQLIEKCLHTEWLQKMKFAALYAAVGGDLDPDVCPPMSFGETMLRHLAALPRPVLPDVKSVGPDTLECIEWHGRGPREVFHQW